MCTTNMKKQNKKTRRAVVNGAPTNDLVFSAYIEGNDKVFPKILDLYVAKNSIVADVTYGKGVFWKHVPENDYDLRPTDVLDGVDCRDLPYPDNMIDCVVLDPPYMHTPGGSAHTTHTAFEQHYRNNATGNRTNKKYHEAVLDLYADAGKEAHRVLKEKGVFIVKCQDEVCSNRQKLTHVELIQIYTGSGFIVEDLFVVVRTNKPGVSRAIKQVHARKNHSYFLVLWKSNKPNRVWKP